METQVPTQPAGLSKNAAQIQAARLVEQYGRKKALEIVARNAGYWRLPCTIDEFIEDDEYMGQEFEKDGIKGGLVYPGWRHLLRELFPDELTTKYELLVLSGCIGSGKSTVSRIIMTYCYHRFLCLEDPHRYYGHQRSNKYVFYSWSPVKGTAGDLLIGEMNQMMKDSPFFKAVRDKAGGWYPHNITMEYGSTHAGAVGKNIPMFIMTEANFCRIHNQAETAFNSLKRRVQSRFMKNQRIPFPIIIDSSISDDQDFVSNILKDYGHGSKVKVVSWPIWEIKPRSNYSAETFKVFIGNDTQDPCILEDMGDPNTLAILENPDLSSRVIEVPIDFKDEFRADILVAIQDIAGVATAASVGFVQSKETVSKSLIKLSPLTQSIIRMGLAPENSRYSVSDYFRDDYWSQFQGQHHIDDFTGDDDYDQYNVYGDQHADAVYFPGASVSRHRDDDNYDRRPRSIHIDLGIKKDLTGISSSYISGQDEITRMNPRTGRFEKYREPVFETEWTVYIGAAPSDEVPISKIREFIVDLRIRGVPIWKITLDGYQSTQIKQDLILLGFNCEIVSVDRTKEPYLTWKRAMMEGRWTGPNVDRLKEEIYGLVDTGKKIDHSSAGIDAKDGVDSVVGSIYNLFQGQGESDLMNNTQDNIEVLDALLGNGDSMYEGASMEDTLTALLRG